jgi:hypothetical protein
MPPTSRRPGPARPSGGRQVEGRPPGPQGAGAGQPLADPDAEALHTLALDLVQLAFDVVGFADPTPITGGANALISLTRGQWLDAALSGACMVPYLGDLARAGKLPRYLRSIEKAVELADRSAAAAKRLLPGFVKLQQALDFLPAGVSKTLDQLRDLVTAFVRKHGASRLVREELPDISSQFRFRTLSEGDRIVKEASGRLGVPGRVKSQRSFNPAEARKAQSGVSRGTGDHAGHMIGDQFGAPPGLNNRLGLGTDNLSLQNARMNSGGTWWDLEQKWADNLQQGYGYEVKVTDWYRPGEARPYKRKVSWVEIAPDGGRQSFNQEGEMGELIYGNFHTDASRAKQGVPPTDTGGKPAKVIPFPGQGSGE